MTLPRDAFPSTGGAQEGNRFAGDPIPPEAGSMNQPPGITPYDELFPEDRMADQLAQATQMADRLDEQFDESLSQLREMYELAETPAEKARIQFLLQDLEARRDAGKQAIDASFSSAIQDTMAQADTMRQQGRQAGQRIGDIFRSSADQTAQLFDTIGEQSADSGFGLGANDELPETATDWVALQQAAAPREQAYAESMFGIGAQDIEALAQLLGGENAAQQGQLTRETAARMADAQMQHNDQVSSRIAQERQALAGQVGNLMGAFRGRGWDLQDQALGIQRDEADQRRQYEIERQREEDAREYERWLREQEQSGQDLSVEDLILLQKAGVDPSELGMGGMSDASDLLGP